MENINISVVLPIESSKHKNFELLFDSCIKSILSQKISDDDSVELVLVHSDEEDLVNKVKSFDYSGMTVNMVVNKGETDFCTQVNLGVENSNNKWISIIEFDDEYSSIWFKNVKRYVQVHILTLNGFLPISC